MKSIKVSILDKPYPLRVEDEEEETMRNIAQYVDDKFLQYKKDLSKQPDSTIMVLAALSIAEELFEERAQSHEQEDLKIKNVNETMESFLQQIRS